MRNTLDEKIYGPARRSLEDFRSASQAVAEASKAQTVLLVALTAVSVTALAVAVIAVWRASEV